MKLLTPSVNNTSAPGVPVKVNVPVCPEQIVLAEMVDVGSFVTVTTALPVKLAVQEPSKTLSIL